MLILVFHTQSLHPSEYALGSIDILLSSILKFSLAEPLLWERRKRFVAMGLWVLRECRGVSRARGLPYRLVVRGLIWGYLVKVALVGLSRCMPVE